jgi:hypothetical protein
MEVLFPCPVLFVFQVVINGCWADSTPLAKNRHSRAVRMKIPDAGRQKENIKFFIKTGIRSEIVYCKIPVEGMVTGYAQVTGW